MKINKKVISEKMNAMEKFEDRKFLFFGPLF